MKGDSEYIRQQLASGRQKKGVDWGRLLGEAYRSKHGNIVTMILNSGRVAIQQQLRAACYHGDSEYIRQHLASGRQEDGVDWEILLGEAYNNKRGDIVTMIKNSGRVAIQQQLEDACKKGDSEYIRQHLASSRQNGVNWELLLWTAYQGKHGDIVTMIQNSGRVAIQQQLEAACIHSDSEYVRQHLVSGRQEDGVDWGRLLGEAYKYKHSNIVTMIQTTGRVAIQQMLRVACEHGDSEYIRQQLASGRQEDGVDWEWLLEVAYQGKHGDIVTMIENSRRVAIQQQLEVACIHGDSEYVRQHLASGRQEDGVDWEWLLGLAQRYKYGDIVTMIKNSGRVAIERQLREACYYGDSEYIRQHLASGRQDSVDWEWLLEVAYQGKHGDIVTMIQNSGRVAIEWQLWAACYHGDSEYVRQHLASGRQDSVDWKWLLGVAYEGKHGDIVTMIENTGRVAIQQQLEEACRNGDSEYIRQHLVSGKQDSVDWELLLWTAYQGKHGDIVTMVQTIGRVAIQQQLRAACEHGDSEYIRQHLASGRQDGVDWGRLLGRAYWKKHGDIVTMIQNSGRVAIQQQLRAACAYGDNVFVCQVIMENRHVDWGECLSTACDNNQLDVISVITAHRHNSKLMLACLDGRVEYVKQHIEDLPKKSMERTHYFKAAFYNKQRDISALFVRRGIVTLSDFILNSLTGNETDMVKHVIMHTADINVDLQPGFTALHIVCCQWSPNIALLRALIACSADVNKKGYKGRTPFHMLCQGIDRTIIEKISGGEMHPDEEHEVGIGKVTKQQGREGQWKTPIECMKYLIENHAKVNVCDDNSQTPSHLLACCHSVGLADIPGQFQVLLDNEADINKQDLLGMTPLALMALHDNVSLMEMALNHGCDITKDNIEGKSPLYISCERGNLKSARILANAENIDIDKQDNDGVTPISICSELGHAVILSLLLEKTFNSLDIHDKDGKVALHKAVIKSQHEAAKELIKHIFKVDVQDIKGNTPLHYAVENRDIDMMTLLLDANCAVDVTNHLGESPLFIAIEKSMKIDEAKDKIMILVDLLLKKGATLSVSSIYRESLQSTATENVTIHIIKWLLDANLLVETKNHLAKSIEFSAEEISMKIDRAKDKTNVIVDTLLEKGATLSVSNIYRESLLSKAVEQLNVDMVLYLLDRGVDMHTVNSKAQGLFHVLVDKMSKIEHNQERTQTFNSIIDILEKHLDINATDINKQTPLHLAAEAGCVSTINILLERGADLTARDKFHFLPLMWSVLHDRAFKMLFEKTLMNLEETDFQKLVKLGHWLNKLRVIQECQSKVQTGVDLHTQPQNFVTKEWCCNEDLSEFYQLGKERLNRHQFLDEWVASQQRLTYINHRRIVQTLSDFIKKVLAKISGKYPLLACEFRLSGSEKEGAKIIATDEMDALSVLTAILFEKFEIPEEPGHPVLREFVKLLCKPEYRDELKPVLDENYYLSRSKLYHLYSDALSDILADPDLWAEYPQIQRISHKDISPGNRTITPLMVLWNDDVYSLLKISIDMVPAIDVKWRPTWASNHPLLDEMETLVVPKWKTTAIEDDQLMEVGISHWGEAFAKMPTEMRNGYRLCKVIKEVCPQIVCDQAALDDWCDDWHLFNIKDIVTSYMMKQIIIKEYAAAFYDNPRQEIPVKTDREWAITIFKKLKTAFKRQELTSFFIPGYNLLHDEKFAQVREKGIKYAKLCKLLLTEKAVEHFRKAYMDVKDVKDSKSAADQQ